MKRILLLLPVIACLALAGTKVTLPVSETGPMTLNFVQGYAFDPLVERPDLGPGLSGSEPRAEYGYYIIQFPGPVQPEWKRAVMRQDVELLWYLPRYAYICRLRNSDAQAVADLPEVRWLGAYEPAYKLCPGLERATGPQTLIVVFHYAEDERALLDELAALGASGFITEFNRWNKSVRIDVDASAIPAIARLPGVHWVEPWVEITPDNRDMQWVDQHGYSATDTTRVIWHKGVTGSSVIVGLTDLQLWTGHDAFRDTAGNTPSPTHRKVIHYFGTQGAASHGTHTGGTLCGNDDYVGGSSWHDGLAKDARLYFQYYQSFPSGWDMNVWFHGPDSGVAGLRAFNHSMSLSRKDTYNIYVFSDMTADQFIWNHPEFMHCNSMGNYGMNRMGHPVMAKNIISTGATQNGIMCESIATFTSRGPTADGRRKPQLVSPGEDLYSAQHTNASGYVQMSGTSMSTPNMTGATALIRDYFRLGFYPTGDTLTGTPMEISAALNKAVAIVGADNDIIGYTVPDNNIGWGRIDLDSSLYFAGDASMLWVMDNTSGLGTGDSVEYDISVTDDSLPFRVALVWSDYPGTMQAAYILVNDLDLTVISPTGAEYKGNVWSGGQSQTGGIYDTLNVEECFRLDSPGTGTWTVRVKARNAPQGPQPFALAAIGMFSAVTVHDVGVSDIVAPVGMVDSGTVVTPRAVVANYGTQTEDFLVRFFIGASWSDTTSVSLGSGAQDTVDFTDWLADSVGDYLVRCTTELATDENPANDCMTDSCTVVPGTGIQAGDRLPTEFALEDARPNPFTRLTTIRYALPRPARVKLAVYTVAGTLVRDLTDAELPAGWYTQVWNAKDNSGRAVSAGIYLLSLNAGEFKATQKLIIE